MNAQLGAGGWGAVYAATQNDLGRPVAAAALGHPNMGGQTLGAALAASRRMIPARVAWIAYQMLAGLDVAHRAGIVHRDIKPDNADFSRMPGSMGV